MRMKRLERSLVIVLLIAIPAGYVLWDMRQAKRMVVDACTRALKGESLEAYLSSFSKEDYRIIVNERECILVPRKGMGRYQCIITHDGRNITGSKTGFLD